ncbi:MAG TPA: hypothetical protein VFX39_10435, partial [Gemmatimonadaceae bacterium]|nr:hypothetical protein [Gemmatimonadaceae bacterium]
MPPRLAPSSRSRRLALALLSVLVACGPADGAGSHTSTGTPVEATDEGGTTVRLAHPARRVVSLVPSGTDLLVALGATEQIVGRTRYDDA